MPILQNTAYTNLHLFTSANTHASRRWALNIAVIDKAEKHGVRFMSTQSAQTERCLSTDINPGAKTDNVSAGQWTSYHEPQLHPAQVLTATK